MLGSARLNQLVKTRSNVITTNPITTPAFDFAYMMVTFILSMGVYADGWSHIRWGSDQSIWSPYHVTFIGAVPTLALLLSLTSFYHWRKGHTLNKSLPQGYGIGAIGIIIFLLANPIDLLGHYLFGFEDGLEALLSPSHVALFVAWIFMLMPPLLNLLRRVRGGEQLSFANSFTGILSFTLLAASLTFAHGDFFAFSGAQHALLFERRINELYFAQIIWTSQVYMSTLLMTALLTWLVIKVPLKSGSLLLIWTVYGGFVASLREYYWLMIPAIITGLLLELAYKFIKPHEVSRNKLMLWGAAIGASMWIAYYGTVTIGNIAGGLFIGEYAWVGSAFYATIIGAAMGFFATVSQPANNKTSINHQISRSEA